CSCKSCLAQLLSSNPPRCRQAVAISTYSSQRHALLPRHGDRRGVAPSRSNGSKKPRRNRQPCLAEGLLLHGRCSDPAAIGHVGLIGDGRAPRKPMSEALRSPPVIV